MTKFSNFLVFAFGGLLLIVAGVFLVSNLLERWAPRPVSSGEATLELPECDLEPLRIEPGAQFHEHLDSIYAATGGLGGVAGHAIKEFVPGRRLILIPLRKSDPPRSFLIVDRELRRCDRNGTALLEEAPVVQRLSSNLRMGSDSVLLTWTRPMLREPFTLTAWCVPAPP